MPPTAGASTVEIRHLRTLIALAETGSFSKAAVAIKLSQPAVSLQIKMLETAYGTNLIQRRKRPFQLTATGRRLISLAYEIQNQLQDAERDIAQLSHGEGGGV